MNWLPLANLNKFKRLWWRTAKSLKKKEGKLGAGWNKNYKQPAEMKIPIQRTILLYSENEA